ncbi:hypothetical protein [Niallia endozanthoxylica]|uniref:Uncharacterized protein n=1 Tax=Niallia endozanthoxylica TaxID=2036016 RepID=A0A5J5HQ88_9BACI|nr:hypothetical protein [Niallia endozanthoxylica]KAA9023902.1 hypothetical protein F4V44_12250 [Niallia endozanthoxylica]
MKLNRQQHKYPFIILGMIHILLLILSMYKSKDRKKHTVLLLNYAGFAYTFEYIVVALLDGYVYKPNFFKNKNLDKIFGSIWSQLFYVPVTALFITVYQLGWKIKLLFGLYFVLIEKLFIFLGIFKNNWWRTGYTFLTILLSFFINDKWYEQLNKRNPFILFISFFHLIQLTWMNTIFAFAVFRKIRLGFPPFLTWKEHFKLAPLVGLFISLFSAWKMKERSYVSQCQVLILMFVIDITLLKKRMLKVKEIPVLLTIYAMVLRTAEFYRKLVYESSSNKSE